MMEFRILGPLEVLADGRAVDLGGQKQRGLLAMLLLEANRVVASDRLVDALWEEEPPETASKALQVYVSQLRKLLGKDRLQTKAPGYLLRVEEGELDLDRFRQLHEERRHAEALSLWRGEPLADFGSQRFARSEIARLDELRLSCLEDRLDADLATGRHSELVGELNALAGEHPLRQRLRAQLMLALYRSGRDAEALAVYQDLRRGLVEGLGIEPGRELRDLHQAILQQDPALDLVEEYTSVADAGRGVFVGRERELAELLGGLDDAFSGHGGLFLLVGEPGIGKSRLADELIARAKARGAQVLVGRCWEAGGAPAYWPWVQSLRAYLREADPADARAQVGAGAADLAQLLPELRALFPGLLEPPAVESEGARFRLFDAASSLLASAARARPLVLVFDDLHAADEPSLLLLQFVARQLNESRMLVVGAYRDVDPGPSDPLRAALTELAREPVTRTLALTGLAEREVSQVIELTAGAAAKEELVLAIQAETEGNPLFVGEIVRLLAAEGALDATALRLAIPQSVRDVIARRLSHLSQECNRVLVHASVLGREFPLDALARVGDLSSDDLLETLDEAMIARVVSDVPGSSTRLRFAHVLIRDTLYEGLTTARRVRLHRQVVEALEALYGDESGPHLAELGYHAVAGSDFDKGLRYAKAAADRALALLAYEEAVRLYQTALDALPLSNRDDETTRCELLLLLGEAESRSGNSPVAKETFLEAAGIARRLSLARELARAAAGYGGRIIFERAGADDRLVPLLEEGLAALGEEDVELRVRLLARLAGALRDEPSRHRRDRLSQEAVELARGSGYPAALAYALDGRLAAIVAPDVIAERLTLANELRDVAEISGERERVVAAHYHRFIARLELGQLSAAEDDLATAIGIATHLRQPAQLWQLTAAQAMLALANGRFDEAEKLAHEALALGERSIAVFAIPAFRLHMYALLTARGEIDELEPLIRATVAEYPARPFIRCLLVHLHNQLGQTEEAREEFNNLAENRFDAVPFDIEWLYGMSLLAETCAALEDRDAAAELYTQLSPYAHLNAVDVPEGMRGSVSRYLGLLASTMQRFDDAEHHYQDALAMNEHLGARPWLAHTQNDYAHMLLTRDNQGDPGRAQHLLDTANATYHELGMHRHAPTPTALQQKSPA
jgi:DNA-binding SARP family transcriptional activator/tetratricopeptide (TPR) repeat protein